MDTMHNHSAHAEHHAAHEGMHHQGGHAGHAGHSGHGDHVGQFRRLFWIMLALAVPVVGFSGMFAMLIGYELPDHGLVSWISPVLGTLGEWMS